MSKHSSSSTNSFHKDTEYSSCGRQGLYIGPSLPRAPLKQPPCEDTLRTVFISHTTDFNTHPSSVMPSRNSFLVNSHWVAARNFHATTNTVMLAGSNERSSQNCWIPSIPILFSSWGSMREMIHLLPTSYTGLWKLGVKYVIMLARTYLCSGYKAAPAFSGPLTISWIPYSTDLDSESSCP